MCKASRVPDVLSCRHVTATYMHPLGPAGPVNTPVLLQVLDPGLPSLPFILKNSTQDTDAGPFGNGSLHSDEIEEKQAVAVSDIRCVPVLLQVFVSLLTTSQITIYGCTLYSYAVSPVELQSSSCRLRVH